MYKNLIWLLCLALLCSCSVKHPAGKAADVEVDNTSWELMFKFLGGKTSIPFDKLYLDDRIPKHQVTVAVANFKTEKGVIVVKYTGIGKAKALEVCDKLEEDKQIEVLALTLMD